MQACEFARDEHGDILDAARRPRASVMGPDAIRFSTRPELGGRALIAEIVPRPGGRAEMRLFTFSGHPRLGWDHRRDAHINLSAAEYRRLATQVDAALARYREPEVEPSNSERIVCTDGPGSLTERVRHGAVVTLVGSCPPAMTVNHANIAIAAAIQDLLCRHRTPLSVRAWWNGRRCFEPQRTMAQWRARGDGE